MKNNPVRYIFIAVLLSAGVWWSMASAPTDAAPGGYPAGELLVDAQWLKQRMDDPNLVVVDVRDDKNFDNTLIPGAVRLPWSDFRYSDKAVGMGGLFVGVVESQKVLGNAGISRTDEIVLYDSVARDGGATASYVFWILELLGHEKVHLLERGIDAWADLGEKTSAEPRELEPVLYQALSEEIDSRKMADGDFIYSRLGDPHYLVVDVRSREEYLGEKANTALDGSPLKLGHIPTSINVDYKDNWADPDSKKIKSHEQLRELYRGMDPSKSVVVYCHSARRSSFTYFILRLMGFSDVIVYEASWYEWGSHARFFPAELTENKLTGALPDASRAMKAVETRALKTPGEKGAAAKGGYVSCGG